MDETAGRLVFGLGLACAQLAITLHVYFRSPRRLANIAFGALGTFLAAWTITIALAHTPLSSDLIVRSTFVAAGLLALSLLTFVSLFPSSPFPWRWWYIPFLTSGAVFAPLALTRAIVAESAYGASGLSVTYGPLYPLYGAYVVATLATTLVLLVKKLRRATGLQRLQLHYLVYALLLPAAPIAVTNLLIPLLFGISHLGRFGPAFSLIFLGVTAHAMIRQRLIDIRLVVGRAVSYGAAVVVTGAIFILGLTILAAQLPDLKGVPLVIQVACTFAAAALAAPATRRLRTLFDRYCYREPYNYAEVIRRSSALLSGTLDLQQLLERLFILLRDSVRPEFMAVYLHGVDSDDFRLVNYDGQIERPELPITIQSKAPLVRRLAGGDRVLFRDHDPDNDETQRAVEWLRRLDVECSYAITHEDRIVAIILLGRKLAGDPYFAHDLDLVSTVTSQAAVALKSAELYRRVALLELQRSRAERIAESGSLSAGIAHEIKNPLVAIRTFAELLPERFDDNEFRIEFSAVVATEIARIEQLVDRLRGLTKTTNEESQPLELRKPLEETLALLSAPFGKAGIRVVREYEETGAVIHGIHDKLKQLFLNLLLNASEAMGGPGQITVRLRSHRGLGLPTLTAEIEDEGPGIAEDLKDTLFHPFVSSKPGSSGLGLWVCRRIVDEHNGTMCAENRKEGRGARFSIDFPLSSSGSHPVR